MEDLTMEENKKIELSDELLQAISGGKLKDGWKFIVKTSVLTYRNYMNRHKEQVTLEDVLAEMDAVMNDVSAGDPEDRKILEEYIREIWKS